MTLAVCVSERSGFVAIGDKSMSADVSELMVD